MARRKKIKKNPFMLGLFILFLGFVVWYGPDKIIDYFVNYSNSNIVSYSIDDIPSYKDSAYVVLDNNVPGFSEEDYKRDDFEEYSKLDLLGRCGVTFAMVSKDSMPKEERGNIGMVKPSGWHTVKYDIVSGKYLYNRCHLIGYQLTGENANERNLITCTRYMNTVGMIPFENQVSNYVRENNDKVLYRVTPVFVGDNLLASGAIIEASSVKDRGKSLSFKVYVYNVQPGISIDYKTGDSNLE